MAFKRKYLNQNERMDVIKMYAAYAELQAIVDRWKKHDFIASTEAKYLNSSITFLRKGLHEIIQRLDRKLVDRLLKDADETDIVVLPKKEAYIAQEEANKRNDTIAIKREMFQIFAEKTLYVCTDMCGENPEECLLRKAYQMTDIEAFNPEAAEYDCEYRNSALNGHLESFKKTS